MGAAITGRRIAGGLAIAGGSVVAVVTLLGLAGLQPFKLNRTSSLPHGLYVRTFEPPRVGAIVWFPLPAALKAYVAGFPGAAQWFDQPGNGLLKPVVGAAGDTICRSPEGVVSLNGHALGRAPAGADGRPLPSWEGCRRLGEGSSPSSPTACRTVSTAVSTALWRRRRRASIGAAVDNRAMRPVGPAIALAALALLPLPAAALSLTEADVEAIGRVVYAEAAHEPTAGKVAVIDTILNRLDSGRFGSSIQSVIDQPKGRRR